MHFSLRAAIGIVVAPTVASFVWAWTAPIVPPLKFGVTAGAALVALVFVLGINHLRPKN